MSSPDDFNVNDMFTAPPRRVRSPRDTHRSNVPWGPLAHTGLAAGAAGGVWTGLDVSGVDPPFALAWSAMVVTFVCVLAVWARSGPVWAITCALLATAFALLTAYPPVAIALGSVNVLAVRAVERTRAVSAP